MFFIWRVKHNNKIFACWLEDLLLISGGDLFEDEVFSKGKAKNHFIPTVLTLIGLYKISLLK